MNTAEDRGQGADRGDDQREDQAVGAEDRLAEDQRGHQGHRVGLEQVGRHAGAVADVVADVVGDGGGVAGVVLGDVVLDLADQVGADVGRLGEDAAADPHEHREQRGAEAEALEHGGGVVAVDENDHGGAQQAQAHGRHAHHAAGTERHPHRRVSTLRAGRRGDPDVGPDRERHAEVPDGGGEAGPDGEEDRAADPDAGAALGREEEQQQEGQHGEDGERLELAREEGRGALLDGQGDPLHVLGALAGGEDLAAEQASHDQRQHRDDTDDDHERQVAAGQCDRRAPGFPSSEDVPGHTVLLRRAVPPERACRSPFGSAPRGRAGMTPSTSVCRSLRTQ